MTIEEAVELAREGVKVTHEYFGSDEYMTMVNNIVIFEDGVTIYFNDFFEGKDYFYYGWSRWEETNKS